MKKQNISNKTILIIITTAIIISLFSLLSIQRQTNINIYDSGVQMTGLVGTNQTIGNITVVVSSYTYINFTNLSTSWGSGFVSSGNDHCNLTIDYDGTKSTTTGCGGDWSSASVIPLAIENLGNEDVALNLSFDYAAASLFGAGVGNSDIQFRTFIGEGAMGSTCLNNTKGMDNAFGGASGGYTNVSAWTSVSSDDWNTPVCPWFNVSSSNNQINVGIKFKIDDTVTTGTKTLTITAYGRTCDGTQGARNNCTDNINRTLY